MTLYYFGIYGWDIDKVAAKLLANYSEAYTESAMYATGNISIKEIRKAIDKVKQKP